MKLMGQRVTGVLKCNYHTVLETSRKNMDCISGTLPSPTYLSDGYVFRRYAVATAAV